jgi:hypothetical protein
MLDRAAECAARWVEREQMGLLVVRLTGNRGQSRCVGTLDHGCYEELAHVRQGISGLVVEGCLEVDARDSGCAKGGFYGRLHKPRIEDPVELAEMGVGGTIGAAKTKTAPLRAVDSAGGAMAHVDLRLPRLLRLWVAVMPLCVDDEPVGLGQGSSRAA